MLPEIVQGVMLKLGPDLKTRLTLNQSDRYLMQAVLEVSEAAIPLMSMSRLCNEVKESDQSFQKHRWMHYTLI